MDRRQERAALQRIVALLLALADLADLARDRSPAVRAVVLWLLRPAEAVAREFIFEASSPAGPVGAAEATRLARSFRALARALQRQARSNCAGSGRALRDFAVTLAQSLAPMREKPGLAPVRKRSAPHDTS